MRLRFPKSARLSRAAEFERVKKEGVTSHGKFMVLKVLQLAEEKSVRAGFVTSRRVGNAVVRNQIRRRLREIVRLNFLRINPGTWLVLIARSTAAAASYRELEQEWLRLVERTSILAAP
ncbi:MAG: ribonuclease P protein component [Verrucomicrobiota bacterium]|nr:ribonuclease P protein component [Verrucomicrobiota bacterium]